MTDKRTYPLLPDEPCLTQEQLFRYIDGKMSSAEMHSAEKHLLDCGLCSDALDGLQLVRNREKIAAFIPPVSGTDTPSEEEHGPVVIPIFRRPAFIYSVAATVTLVLGITVLLKFSISNDTAKEAQLAENTSRMSDSIASPAPSEQPGLTLEEKTKTDALSDQEKAPAITDANAQPKASTAPQFPADKYFESAKPAPYKTDNADAAPPVMAEADMPAVDFSNVPSGNSSGTSARSESVADDTKKEDQHKLKNFSDKVVESIASKDKSPSDSRAGLSSKNNAPAAPASGAKTADEDISEKQTATDTVSSGPYPLKASDADLDLSYQKGVQLLDAGNAAASLVFFDEVLKKPAHHYYQDAQWKKAEALIKLNRKEEAKVLLNDLASKEGKYKAQATEKLKGL